jgi:hypothetical protein
MLCYNCRPLLPVATLDEASSTSLLPALGRRFIHQDSNLDTITTILRKNAWRIPKTASVSLNPQNTVCDGVSDDNTSFRREEGFQKRER